MEASKVLNPRGTVISELIQGRELAKQLQNHLDPSTPQETREFLIEKILSTYNKLLEITNPPCKNSFPVDHNSHQISFHGGTTTKTPCSQSHCSDLDDRGHPSKRRKTVPKWVKKVEARAEGGEERNLSDGYNWRKYGQKAILGAKFPRGYYRCSHLHRRGCGATKQVQRSNEDPTIFHVTYRGHHTCSIYMDQQPSSTNPGTLGPSPSPSPYQEEIQNHEQTPDLDIFSEFLGVDLFSASPDDTYHETGTSAPDSPLQFLLDDFGIHPNFPFHGPEFMFG